MVRPSPSKTSVFGSLLLSWAICQSLGWLLLPVSGTAMAADGTQTVETSAERSNKKEDFPRLITQQASAKPQSEMVKDAGQGEPLLPQPVSKNISLETLSKFEKVSISIDDRGKTVKYSGPTLRSLLAEEIHAIDSMKDWNRLAREKVVIEVVAKDDFPALFSATELATNKSGERFILATESDGKALENIRLICPNDEHRVRWVRDVQTLKFFRVDQ